MAYSNRFGSLLLNTSNKSEFAVGYSTLYGDQCGGLSVIGDLLKREVYQLARFFNEEQEVIPSFVIDRAPSAESPRHPAPSRHRDSPGAATRGGSPALMEHTSTTKHVPKAAFELSNLNYAFDAKNDESEKVGKSSA